MTKQPNRKQRRAKISRKPRQAFVGPVTLVDDGWYTDEETGWLYGKVHPKSIWRWARLGLIPAPVKLGPNIARWSGRSIRLDLKKKAQQSQAA